MNRQRRTAACQLTELEPLRQRERPSTGEHAAGDERVWQLVKLYALSRVSDYLIELFCPEGQPPTGFGVTGGSASSQWEIGGGRSVVTPGWTCSRTLDSDRRTVHTDFLSGIGLTSFEHPEAFSPFHHEIFAVVQDPSATSVTVEEVLWPGFWFGDLLFSRAGVRVRAPRHLIDATVATTSTLYFTLRRQPRPTNDLSHGWGSNSQWRTRFRRFYSDQEGLHLNWDGEVAIGDDSPVPLGDRPDHDEHPLDQRRELLLHRCLIREPLPPDENDRYPYGDRLSLTTAEWPLSPESIVHIPRARWDLASRRSSRSGRCRRRRRRPRRPRPAPCAGPPRIAGSRGPGERHAQEPVVGAAGREPGPGRAAHAASAGCGR